MRITLTENELSTLEQEKDGFSYRLNGDFKRSGFKTKEDAIKDAEHHLKKFVLQRIKK
jgi:hypothetical protein